MNTLLPETLVMRAIDAEELVLVSNERFKPKRGFIMRVDLAKPTEEGNKYLSFAQAFNQTHDEVAQNTFRFIKDQCEDMEVEIPDGFLETLTARISAVCP